MQKIVKESHKYSDEKKIEFAEKLRVIQQRKCEKKDNSDSDVIQRLFEVAVAPINGHLETANNRSKYLICATDAKSNKEYIFCSICALLGHTNSKLRVGYSVHNINFASANAIIKAHENSKTHLKLAEQFHRMAVDDYVNIVIPVDNDLVEVEAVESIESAPNTTNNIFTAPSPAAIYSNIRKITIDRNRKIVADVIQCILFLTSFGKSKILNLCI